MDIHAYQYDKENQLAVDIWVFVHEDTQMDNLSGYSEILNQRYEYFQHIVDHIHLQTP